MGPEASYVTAGSYTSSVPPSFDGRSNYSDYRKDVEMWTHLTSMVAKRQGPAVIGRLSGEAKASAMTSSIDDFISDKGVNLIIKLLDKLCAVNVSAQLDLDVEAFFEYYWQSDMTFEQFISGFHNRLDAISELQMNDKLKGHLLLGQAKLDAHTKNLIVDAASRSFEVESIATVLRQAYTSNNPPASMPTSAKKTE